MLHTSHYSHYTDEETDSQGQEVVQSCQGEAQGFGPYLSDPEDHILFSDQRNSALPLLS